MVVGHFVGVAWTVLLVLAGMALGALLIRRSGESFRGIAASLGRGQMPSRDVAQTGWTMLGGALFVFPGFVTDLLGLLVIVPVTRRLLTTTLLGSARGNTTWIPPVAPTQGDDAEPTVVRGDVL